MLAEKGWHVEVRVEVQERVQHRPVAVPGPRMHDEPRDLVHHQDLGVFMEDLDGDGLGLLAANDRQGGGWTWSEHASTPGGPGGRFLIYQGQVRPGGKMGDVIQNEEWRGKRR